MENFPIGLGFLQSLIRDPLMAILYVYFDESGKKSDHPVVTITCVCVTQPKLHQFEDAWGVLLRRYDLPGLHMMKAARLSQKYGCLMPARQSAEQRMNALIPFADCINEHLEYGVIQAIDIKGFRTIFAHAKDDPYYLAFDRAMLELANYTQKEDRISLICDDDTQTAWDCYRHYRKVRGERADIQKKTIALSFADDDYFPALQAADMVAYLSRLEAKTRFYGDRYNFQRLFNHLITDKGVGFMKWVAAFADQKVLESTGEALRKLKQSSTKKKPGNNRRTL